MIYVYIVCCMVYQYTDKYVVRIRPEGPPHISTYIYIFINQ